MTIYLYNRAMECLLVRMLHLFLLVLLVYLSNQRWAKGPEVSFLSLGHLPYCPFLEGVCVCVCGRRGTDDPHTA